MPQARSGGGRKSSASRGSSSGRSSSARSASSRSSGGARKTTSRSSGTRSGGTRSSGARSSATRATTRRSNTGRGRSTTTRKATGRSSDARADAVAQRLRKLNERIIDAGREAGESTLSSYEKVLKSVADAIQRGPGSSNLELVSNLFTAQAKILRDIASSSTSAARRVLK